MTDEQLAEWERLASEATPGPWELGWVPTGRYVNDGHAPARSIYDDGKTPVGDCADCGESPLVNAHVDHTGQTVHIHQTHVDRARANSDAHSIHSTETWSPVAGNYDYEQGGIVDGLDARFMVAAREAVPALIAAYRSLRAAYRERGEHMAQTVAALRAVTGVDGDMGAQLEAVAAMAQRVRELRNSLAALEREMERDETRGDLCEAERCMRLAFESTYSVDKQRLLQEAFTWVRKALGFGGAP